MIKLPSILALLLALVYFGLAIYYISDPICTGYGFLGGCFLFVGFFLRNEL